MAKEQSRNVKRGCDRPISGRSASVTIEYTNKKGQRVAKFFEEAYKARSFYGKKFAEGKQPKVVCPKESQHDV